MRDIEKLPKQVIPLVVASILIGLDCTHFRESFTALKRNEISDSVLLVIEWGFNSTNMSNSDKTEKITQLHSFISNDKWLNTIPNDHSTSPYQNCCNNFVEVVLTYN